MEFPGLAPNFYSFAYSLLRLSIAACMACRRIRFFREPDGITYHPVGKILAQRHRIGDGIRWVVPARNVVDPFARHAKIPWLWIGITEDLGDYTEDLANYMVPGNVITPGILRDLFPEMGEQPIRYLCSTSLEMKEFPSGGITIDALA